MSNQYSLMVHFIVSMLYQHRVPTEGYRTLGEFHEKHKRVLDEIYKAALNDFKYELSHAQIGQAIGWYLKCYPREAVIQREEEKQR